MNRASRAAAKAGTLPEYFAKKHRAHGFYIEKDARESALRGAAKRAALYVIDGQYVTADELAARMGIDKRRAINRFAKAKAKPGAVTWAKLGVSDVGC